MIYAIFALIVFSSFVVFHTLATGGVPEPRTKKMKRRVRNYR